jgi:histone deacetylase 6
MEEDEDTVMGESRSLTNLAPSSMANHTASVTQTDVSSTTAALQPPSVLGLPPPTATVMSPPGFSSDYNPAPLLTSSYTPDLHGLTRSIEDEASNVVKSSEESDSLMEENSDWSADDQATSAGLTVANLATGLCYDIRMRYHCEVRPTADVHPEDPRRIYYIYKEICLAGLVEDSEIPAAVKPLAPRPLQRIDVRDATQEEVQLVHTDEHFKFVENTRRECTDRF